METYRSVLMVLFLRNKVKLKNKSFIHKNKYRIKILPFTNEERIIQSNGMFKGELELLRKHTTKVTRDVQGIVEKQILSLNTVFDSIAEDIEVLKASPIKLEDVHRITGELFMQDKLLTTTQIRVLRDELYQSENFKMLGEEGVMSHWNMYNNITEALKISNPRKYVSDHSFVHSKMMKEVHYA